MLECPLIWFSKSSPVLFWHVPILFWARPSFWHSKILPAFPVVSLPLWCNQLFLQDSLVPFGGRWNLEAGIWVGGVLLCCQVLLLPSASCVCARACAALLQMQTSCCVRRSRRVSDQFHWLPVDAFSSLLFSFFRSLTCTFLLRWLVKGWSRMYSQIWGFILGFPCFQHPSFTYQLVLQPPFLSSETSRQ